MQMSSPIGVTGATGEVGGRVAARLAALGRSQRLVVRDPDKAPKLDGAEVSVASYDDDEAMRQALAGVKTMFFVSAHEDPDRVGLHITAIDAAVEAGVERIIYLSFMGAAPDATFTFARDHYHTEQYIKATGVAWTSLRNSLYLDFMPFFAGDQGVIRGPAGTGRFAPVARDDIADAVVGALTSGAHDGEIFNVTGPEKFTMAEVAETLSRAAGREVTYIDETLDEARASRSGYGAPDWEVEGWVTSYAAIATGEMDIISDAIETLAGHAPISLDAYLHKYPESLDALRAG